MILENIIQVINNSQNIVLLTHENPDGDAVGSSLALYNVLKQLNKDVDMIIPEAPEVYSFLPGYNDIKRNAEEKEYETAIALDCSDIKRLNGFAKYFENAKNKIVIDHHGSNTMFGDYNFVNPVVPACCQILIPVIESLGIEINKPIGECITAGIITDTGGFKYSSVTAETFEFISELINVGVNVSQIYKIVLQTISRRKFELMKIALSRMEFLSDEKIAFTYITKQEQDYLHIENGDHEGIVEYGRDIEGVEVSIFLREQEENVYRVSFRSNDYVNVSDICLMFGGGGHPRAAGCTINSSLEQAKEKLISQTKLYLK